MSPRKKKVKTVPVETAIAIAMRFFNAGCVIERERLERVLTDKLREWGYIEEAEL